MYLQNKLIDIYKIKMDSTISVELIPQEIKGKTGQVKFNPKDTPFFGLYFSAHWCPPCRGFTPKLINFYNVVNKNNKQLEIIFVSSDKSEAEFNEYYDSMPWLSIPFKDESIQNLKETFEIMGIPTFLVFNSDGKLIDGKARTTVENRYPKDGYTEQTTKTIIDIWSGKQN